MTILSNLTTLISATAVATAAGFSQSDWSNYHVFVNKREMTQGMNRGRAPYLVFFRNDSTFTSQTVGSIANDAGGDLETSFTLRVVSSKTNEAQAEDQIKTIASAALASIRTDSRYRGGVDTIGAIQVFPWGSFADCTININNTYSQGGRLI